MNAPSPYNRPTQWIQALILLLSAEILCVAQAAACMGHVRPFSLGTDSDDFRAIVVGEVVGVYLTAYVDFFQREKPGVDYLQPDATPQHEVRVFVRDTIRGGSAYGDVISLNVMGCGIPMAKLNDRGLFFITSKGNKAIPVYNGERQYDTWYDRAVSSSRK